MRIRSNQNGFMGSIIGVIVLSFLLVGATAFGIWAFTSRADYKTNSDKKSAAAVETALAAQKATLEKDFAEREKQPFDVFTGPSEQGSLKILYPKTWELYAAVVATNTAMPVDAFAQPGFVPSITGDTPFALRFQILSQDYSALLRTYDTQLKTGAVRVSPIRVAKVPSVLGARIDGVIDQKKSGTVVLLPIRDKVLKIWTENTVYASDFDTILSNLEFSP